MSLGGSRKALQGLAGYLLLILSVAGVAYARPKAAASTRAVKISSDVFALPSPSALIELSLGYRSALADLLYTSTAISYGAHGEEHRRFEFVGQYLDSIVALDPQFCATYRYADLFLVYQAVGNPTPDDIRHARRLVEQGLKMCPNDGQLWVSAGQFMAFIGPQFLTDTAEIDDFRAAGARTLARAAEIVHDGDNTQWQALSAAGLFSRRGDREAAVSFLERVYSVTESPDIKADVERKLTNLRQEGVLEQAKRRTETLDKARGQDLPFVSRNGLLVIGPRYPVARCSGGRGPEDACANNWRDWFASHPVP